MRLKVGVEEVAERMEHYERMSLTGANKSQETDLGPPILLWRRFRNGEETWETLPTMIAELTLEAIPTNEPNVVRAKLCQERDEHHI